MSIALIAVLGGLVALVAGGELLIRGASKLAAAAGVSSLVIGLTVVAFGTSAPELVVSIRATLAGNSSIAVANVVGSNLFNTLFILGSCALISPLLVTSQLVRLDLPIMVGSSLALILLAWDQRISQIEGILLFSTILVYTVFLVIKSRSESKAVKAQFDQEFSSSDKLELKTIAMNLVFILLGLGLLVVGGGWLVDGAITMAANLGVSDRIIGLTIVAAGTSLPEVATSILATMKGERDLAIGNVVGSNIYNILAILGLSSIVAPTGLEVPAAMLSFDIPIMIVSALLCLPIFFTGWRISRAEGLFFLTSYIAFTTYIVMGS